MAVFYSLRGASCPGFVTVARRGSCGVVPAYICKHLIGFKVLKPGMALAPNQLMPRLQAPCTSGLPGHICLCDRRWRLSTDSFPKATPCCGTRLPAGPHAGEAVFKLDPARDIFGPLGFDACRWCSSAGRHARLKSAVAHWVITSMRLSSTPAEVDFVPLVPVDADLVS